MPMDSELFIESLEERENTGIVFTTLAFGEEDGGALL